MLSRHSKGLYIWMKSEFANCPQTLELKAVKAVPLYKLSLFLLLCFLTLSNETQFPTSNEDNPEKAQSCQNTSHM